MNVEYLWNSNDGNRLYSFKDIFPAWDIFVVGGDWKAVLIEMGIFDFDCNIFSLPDNVAQIDIISSLVVTNYYKIESIFKMMLEDLDISSAEIEDGTGGNSD